MIKAAPPKTRITAEQLAARIGLAASMVMALAAGAYLSFSDHGIYWPDEIMKSIEQAHRLVFGYGLIPWEFQRGADSWFFPAFLAIPMKLSSLVGLNQPSQYLFVVRMTMVILTTATGYATYRLAKSYDASDLYAAIAGAVSVLAAPVVYFGSRALTETASMFPVAMGLAFCLEKNSSRKRTFMGALLLAISVFLRLQNGIFAVGVLVVLAFRKDRKTFLPVVVVFGIAAFAFGLLDLITWHRWFNSAFEYYRFNVTRNGAAGWGITGRLYYAHFFRHSLGPLAFILAVLVLLSARKSFGLLALASAFFVAHSVVGHKEARFIMPMFPLLCAMAAVGMEQIKSWTANSLAYVAPVAVAITLGLSFAQFHQLTFGDLAQTGQPAPASAYSFNGGINSLLLAANKKPGLCGLFVPGQYWSSTGGYSYLHRRVPFYDVRVPPPSRDSYNYEIVDGHPPNGVAYNKNWALLKTADSCRPDPAYSFRRPG